METYRVLSLIGSIFGILIGLGLIGIAGLLMMTKDVIFNTTSLNETEQRNFEEISQLLSGYTVILIVATLMYVTTLTITFVVKTKIKIVGVILLVLGALGIPMTLFFGIVAFGLLLPAGILALRHKDELQDLSDLR